MRLPAAAFIVATVVVTALAIFLALSMARAGSFEVWALAGAPSIILAAISCVWAKREAFLREWLTPRWGDITRGILGAGALFSAAWAFVRVIAPVGSAREIWLVSLYAQIGDPRALQDHAAVVLALIATVASAEEIVWRGMVSQLLAEYVGSRTAWLWATGLYVVACVPSMWALRSGGGLNPVLVAAALGGGLVWGGMARLFGTLVPSILAHALFDWIVVMVFPLWGARLAGLP